MDAQGQEKDDSSGGLFRRLRGGIAYLHANKKRLFWWWAAYQSIKGAITLSLIWIPLLILWLRNG
ncbi:MAG: hypothetical protein AAGI03_17875 [Pseudomonadota bacterium]